MLHENYIDKSHNIRILTNRTTSKVTSEIIFTNHIKTYEVKQTARHAKVKSEITHEKVNKWDVMIALSVFSNVDLFPICGIQA